MKERLPKVIIKDNQDDPDDENQRNLANIAADEGSVTPITLTGNVSLTDLEYKKTKNLKE